MNRVFLAPCLLPIAGFGLAGAAGLGHGPACAAVLSAGIALVAAQIAWQDLASFTIADPAVAALAILGVAARLSVGSEEGGPALVALGLAGLDGVICGGALLLVREGFYRWRGYDGLGFGDVKLALAGGILVGTEGFAWTVFAASLGGLAIAAWLTFRRGQAAEPRRLPYGTLLAPTLCLVWLLTVALPQIQPVFPVAASGMN